MLVLDWSFLKYGRAGVKLTPLPKKHYVPHDVTTEFMLLHVADKDHLPT